MKIFRFDPEVSYEIEQSGNVKSVISDEAVVNCVCIRPNGKIGFHPIVTRQLFLLVEGGDWVRGESEDKSTVYEGQAAFLEKGEWHETGVERDMTAVIIEGANIQPDEFMLFPWEEEL